MTGADRLVLVAIVTLAFVVRFWGLGTQSLWYDEWSTAQAVGRNLPATLHFVAEREGSPPGYFVVAWVWVRVLGDGAGTLRALSALAGTAVVPVTYAVVSELSRSRAAARVAALLVALHPLLVWYSQEARPYSLLVLASSLSLLGFARSWKRGRRSDLLLWGLASAAAVGVHYFAAFLVFSEGLALVLLQRRRWRSVVLAVVPVVVVAVGLVPTVLEQRRHAENQSWINGFQLQDRLADAGRSALVGPNPPHERLWLVIAALAAVAIILGVRAGSRSRSVITLTAALGAGAALLPLAALAVGVDLFLGRYVVSGLLPLLVATAVGLAIPNRRWLGAGCVALLCAISIATLVAVAREPAQQRPAWREVARVFEDEGGGGKGGRLLVLNVHGGLATPLLNHVSEGVRALESGEEALVEEIDVVVLKSSTAPCNFFVGSACALLFLGGPLPPSLEGRFELEEQRELDQFRIDRYRTARPVRLDKEKVVRPWEVAGSLVLLRP